MSEDICRILWCEACCADWDDVRRWEEFGLIRLSAGYLKCAGRCTSCGEELPAGGEAMSVTIYRGRPQPRRREHLVRVRD